MALILSFAARLAATIGDDCSMNGTVSTSHVRSFQAAFDCIAGTRIGQEMYEILRKFRSNLVSTNLQRLWSANGTQNADKWTENDESDSI